MSVNTGHESQSNGSTDGLCDPALVDWSKTGLVSVLDASHRGHVFGHNREILSFHPRQPAISFSSHIGIPILMPRVTIGG